MDNIIPAGQVDPNHFYPTPDKLCEAVISRIDRDFDLPFSMKLLDPGAGNGPWGKAYKEYDSSIFTVGVELQNIFVDKYYDYFYSNTNFLDWENQEYFDIVIGNPPFKLAEEFIRHSLSLMNDGGYLVFLPRSAFKESAQRWYKNNQPGLFQTHCYVKEYQLVQRPGFKPNKHGKNSPEHAYSIFVWQKNNYPDLKTDWPISDWISWK